MKNDEAWQLIHQDLEENIRIICLIVKKCTVESQ